MELSNTLTQIMAIKTHLVKPNLKLAQVKEQVL